MHNYFWFCMTIMNYAFLIMHCKEVVYLENMEITEKNPDVSESEKQRAGEILYDIFKKYYDCKKG